MAKGTSCGLMTDTEEAMMFKVLRKLLTNLFGQSATVPTHSPRPENTEISRLAVKKDATHSEISEPSEAHSLLYDETLLERTRTNWHQGEWESLVRIDMSSIEHHPDRAKLSLAVASAWLQQGDTASAKRFLRCAMNWGCDKKLIAQTLSACVDGTLGRAAALAGDQVRMEQHFSQAIAGSGNEIERASLGRRHVELQRLGLEKMGLGLPLANPYAINNYEIAITYPPRGITSYAQNFEDVMLWRALWDVEEGFYIDVGAWDPVIDSVSKAFYEQGWRGVHVEPLGEYAEKIRQDRPEDKVIQALVSKEPGEMLFHAIPLTGLSTSADCYASNAGQAGWPVEDRIVPCVTLSQIFLEIAVPDIHWLKIDVEGMESVVLTGWGTHHARPWVVVIEATEPLSSKPSWTEWESLLITRDYRFVYFDGLNRFYLHKLHLNLINRFAVAPNVFDSYRKHIPESRPDGCIPNSN